MNLKSRLSKLTILCVAALMMQLTGPAIADDAIDNLTEAIAERFPKASIGSLEQTIIPGLYQLVAGNQVVYMDATGRYMLDGNLIDLDTGKNFTEKAKAGVRLAVINALSDDELLVYQPEKVEHTITVITDIDCPYCRKLHSEMDEYLDNNVKVRYILLPLKGKKDYENSISVWCSEDRNLALDIAKAGGGVEKLTCAHPLAKHKIAARKLGVSGTPAIVLENGKMLPGYVPVAELMKLIREES